jgi:hypothetical protein
MMMDLVALIDQLSGRQFNKYRISGGTPSNGHTNPVNLISKIMMQKCYFVSRSVLTSITSKSIFKLGNYTGKIY